MATLRRKGAYWYLRDRSDGADTEYATGATDRKAAEAWRVQWERDRADPEGAARRAAASTTLREAADREETRWANEARAGKLAEASVDFYQRKLGTVLRMVGPQRRLADVTSVTVDRFIDARRNEQASDHTIAKELYVLRAMLDTARRARRWFGVVDDVMPRRFSPNYRPRDRFLTIEEVQRVIAELPPDRAAWVALAVGAGAELAALQAAERGDLDLAQGLVRLRGTKNERRDREVPLVLPVCQALVEQAFQWGEGSGRKLLRPWTKNWRDLDDVATRLQIAPFSLHSLRHTFATWHLAAGISWDDTAHALGHADTTMLHRTYGHLGGVELRRRLLRTLREGAKTSPDVPRHGARGALPAHAARSPQNDESPSFEGLSGYRRSELNQRPWDYDSPALTD